MSLKIYILTFLFYSFIGFMIETIYTSIMNKKFTNRGFLIGPWCPIYGVGALLLFPLSYFKKNIILLFFLSILLFSIIEYLTSFIMEKLFNAKWWDYSDEKININGRICIKTMLPFGLFGLVSIYIINPNIINFFYELSNTIAIILTIIFIIDLFISIFIMTSIGLTKKSNKEVNKTIKDILLNKSYLKRRYAIAFKNIK